MPAVPKPSRYTLASHPPAEWASRDTGAPPVASFMAFMQASTRFRYLHCSGQAGETG